MWSKTAIPRARHSLSCPSTTFVSTALSAIVVSSKTASSLGTPRCFAIIFAMAPVRMWRLERRPTRREEEEEVGEEEAEGGTEVGGVSGGGARRTSGGEVKVRRSMEGSNRRVNRDWDWDWELEGKRSKQSS